MIYVTNNAKNILNADSFEITRNAFLGNLGHLRELAKWTTITFLVDTKEDFDCLIKAIGFSWIEGVNDKTIKVYCGAYESLYAGDEAYIIGEDPNAYLHLKKRWKV